MDQGHEDGFRARSGSGLSGSNPDGADLEGAEVEEILNHSLLGINKNTNLYSTGDGGGTITTTTTQQSASNISNIQNGNHNYSRNHSGHNSGTETRNYNGNQENCYISRGGYENVETPITSPSQCMTSPNGNCNSDSDVDGMESDGIDSTNDYPRKRNESSRLRGGIEGRSCSRSVGKRRKRIPNRSGTVPSGCQSSSQLSSPTCDDPRFGNDRIPNMTHHMIHQTDNDDQQHNDFFTFSRPPQLPRYSHKTQEARLVIVAQPADHHRARYESEGSRGAVKDQSGESSPKIKV
jgi:hypothetical protein